MTLKGTDKGSDLSLENTLDVFMEKQMELKAFAVQTAAFWNDRALQALPLIGFFTCPDEGYLGFDRDAAWLQAIKSLGIRVEFDWDFIEFYYNNSEHPLAYSYQELRDLHTLGSLVANIEYFNGCYNDELEWYNPRYSTHR